MSKQQFSEGQQKAKVYLERYHIEEIISDMINTISHVQMPDPIIFMVNLFALILKIKFLANFHVEKEELIKNGISVSSQSMPKPILYIPFPQFPPNCTNMLKQTLQNKELFFSCKNNYTSFKNNFRQLMKLCQDSSKHKVGLFALDQDCYEAFEPLFKNVLEQHNKSLDQEFKYLKYYQPSKDLQKIFEDTSLFVEECIIKMNRNVDEIQFNSALSENQRAQLNKKIQLFLKTQNIIKFSTIINIVEMNLDEAKKLSQLSDNLLRKDQIHAIGLGTYLNTKKRGPRFADWPKNRSIAMSSDKLSMVWINKEDHFQLKTLSGKQSNLEKALTKVFSMNQVLEENLGLAFSEKYGYLNVKPQNTGLGITMTFKLKINPADIQKFKQNAHTYKKQNNPWFSVKDSKEGTKWVIQLLRNASLNNGDLMLQLSILLQNLFQGIIFTQHQQPSSNQANNQDYDFQLPIEHFDFYEENIEKILKYTKKDPYEKFLPNDLIEIFDNDVIYYNDTIITGKYFIVRRNLLQKSTTQTRDQLLRSALHREIHEVYCLNYHKNAGKWISHSQNDYTQIVSKYFTDIDYKVNFLGTAYFISQDSKLIALANVDDHFLIFHKIESFSISQSMIPLINILNSLEQTITTNGYSFAESAQIGYLTKLIANSGSAISLHFTFKESLINNNQTQGLSFTSNTSLTLDSIGPKKLSYFCDSFNKFLIPSKRNLVTYLCFPLALSQIQMKDLAGLYSEEVPELQDQSILNSKCHNGLTLLDCWTDHKLWAPDLHCFDVFRPLYESYTTKFCTTSTKLQVPILQKFDHRTFKNTELEFVKQLKISVPDNLSLEVSFQIFRNFDKLDIIEQ